MTATPKPRVKRRLALLEFYAELDVRITRMHEHFDVSCRRGCSACCRMPVMMSVVEAEYIVDRYPNAVRRALPALRAQRDMLEAIGNPILDSGRSLLLDDKSVDEVADKWWDLGQNCALLVNGECSVYEARPYPCRYYHVTSDPALCGDVGGTLVQVVEPIEKTMGFQIMASMQPGHEVALGYLQHVVLEAAKSRL